MVFTKQKFDEIKNSKNPETINDFLLELSDNPNAKHLEYLDYFIKNLDPQIFAKIKLSLIFILGEMGKLTQLSDHYLRFIEDVYYKSDRWVRNEIIQAISKISKKSELNEKTVELLSNALNDEYIPIKINTLNLLLNFKNLPDTILKNLILLMNSRDQEILEGCRRVLERFPQQPDRIFHILDSIDNYRILKPRGIRALLLIQFKSIINAESFREMIINANWEERYKENYLKELNTFERILLQNM
ncbi:MAG: hypothetical protein KGD58_07980 [Candidatus Lokiarchaeota archaeon]|nr:hypothetical protein [Candidatus Lokiarchaeota archaeon]